MLLSAFILFYFISLQMCEIRNERCENRLCYSIQFRVRRAGTALPECCIIHMGCGAAAADDGVSAASASSSDVGGLASTAGHDAARWSTVRHERTVRLIASSSSSRAST